jgi:murein DD-endopeptidase MepM/ murein hydrolase activator NlpD
MTRALALAALLAAAPAQEAARKPLHVTVDLALGETRDVALGDKKVSLRLLDVKETRDGLCSAVWKADVKVAVDGAEVTLSAGTYNLPVAVGAVQIDCPVTKGVYANAATDYWALEKDARFRLWPAGSPLLEPGTFGYPLRQRWFAGDTWMANEPVLVGVPKDKIYYHSGLDIGGCEGRIEVVAATDGRVVLAGKDAGEDCPDVPVRKSYAPSRYADTIYILDDRGWVHWYVHLQRIDVRVGQRVRRGETIGILGKEGGSGGWAHLHYEIFSRQPSGRWGTENGYPFLWEAYVRQHAPPLLAVAGPVHHQLATVGQVVALDGRLSRSFGGEITRYEWLFTDGTRAAGAAVSKTYDRPGTYSETLKATDSKGHVDYDFALIQVVDPASPRDLPPRLNASYAPTFGIQPGDPVTFKARTWNTKEGHETWDFGDGSAPVTTRSENGYAETVHRFGKPGHYLVRVDRTNGAGVRGTTHLQVRVGEKGVPDADKGGKGWLDRKVLPPEEGRGMMQAFLERQLAPLPLPQSREAWVARRDALRRDVLRVLGIDDLVPSRGPPTVRAKGTVRRDGYRLEKLTFESWPGMEVPAVLYVPDGLAGRAPGIVSISGHTDVSKAADYVQRRNVNLALRGCVVLAYDYAAHGERRTAGDARGPEGANGHGIRSFSFSRRTATGLEVLDAVRALDVLASRPEVDAARLGFTGESGGGNSTYWAAAVDSRVKLAVPVSSVTTFDYWIRTDVNWDWHQRPPGIRRLADIGTLLALHAPEPLLVISSRRGTDDQEFPLDEAERSHQWARHVYRLLSAEDAVAHYESTTAHGYQEDKRRELYRWVERWLRPPFPKGEVELPVQVEAPADLRAGLPETNRTARDVYAEWVRDLPRGGGAADLRPFLRERLSLPEPPPPLRAERSGREERGSWAAEFWLFEPEPGVRLPGVLIARPGSDAPVVLVPGRDPAGVARALAGGRRAFALDLRGTGEMRHGEGGIWVWFAGPPWPSLLAEAGGRLSNWAWLAGRPWPGMWALDLHQAARLCREKFAASSVHVDAQGPYGWAALLAGAAAPDLLESGTVRLPFESLHDVLRARQDAALADVPGLLERIDVAQLRALWPGATLP